MTGKTFIASCTLIGSAIGAGVLGIPYVIMQSGFPIGLLHLILIATIFAITMLYLGEIALRTKKPHQLTGYAEKYLGKTGKKLMFISIAFGIFAAILAYLIGEGQSLSHIFFSHTNYSIYFALAFWLFMTILSRLGLKALEKGEEMGVIFVLVLIIAIIILSINKIDISNLTYIAPQNFLAPFGVILFAFLAFTTIPEIEKELGKDRHLIKRVIIIAHIVIFIAYLLFTIAVLGWKGISTPPLSTLALGKPFVLLGIFTMFTAYLALSIALIDALRLDYKLSKNKAWLIVSFPPLLLYLLLTLTNSLNFTKVLGIGGVISGGLTAILILLMIPKAKAHGDRKPEYKMPYSKLLTIILTIIFVIGALVEIWNVVN